MKQVSLGPDAPMSCDALVAGTSFRKEAAAFTAIADVLEGRPKEEACAIMCGVCAVLGFYDEAERFLDLARHSPDTRQTLARHSPDTGES